MTDLNSASSSEQSDSLSSADMLNIVAHDLKTPISAVKGFLDLMQQSGPLTPAQEQFLERAFSGLQRMERLIANVLDLAQLDFEDVMNMAAFDLASLINEALEMVQGLAVQHGITIESDVQEDAHSAYGDERFISLVVNNLIGNAVKYNRDNGTISIRAYRHSGGIRVDVRDTGVGISSQDQQRIFKPFVRARIKGGKAEGSGLGLAIVEMVIRKHNGKVWVESTPGEGSTFSFTLPIEAGLDSTSTGTMNTVGHERPDGVSDDLQDSTEQLDPDAPHATAR